MSFSDGSSWSTYGIMFPIAIPVAFTTGANLPLVLGAVFSGGIFGDHASPISDTTIVSSLAAATDHVAHVRTQLPYALLVGGVALLLGTVPAGYGVPWWVGLLVGALLLGGILRLLGRPVDEHDDARGTDAP